MSYPSLQYKIMAITRACIYAGTSIRCGACGFTSVTPFNSALITSSDPDFPACLISFTCDSASLLASSSACLFPLVCWDSSQHGYSQCKKTFADSRRLGMPCVLLPCAAWEPSMAWVCETYLRLELLELGLLGLPICIDLLLCLVPRLLYALCAVYIHISSLIYKWSARCGGRIRMTYTLSLLRG
jgi:hypothetical protein